MSTSTIQRCGVCVAALSIGFAAAVSAEIRPVTEQTVVDMSPPVSMERYQWWPGGNKHHQPVIVPYVRHGAKSPFAADLLIVDENTATQLDCPPHMMPTQGSGLPNAGYWGFMTCDRLPAWQMLGEVVRLDGRAILDHAAAGTSPVYTVDMIKDTERKLGRELGPGDVVLYWSGFDDKYDQAGDAGKRLLIEPIAGTVPAWPDPTFDTQDYIGAKGVRMVGVDSPSIGAFGDPDYVAKGPSSFFQNPKALESHLGLFKHGGIDVEGIMNIDKVPDGSLFIALPVKHYNSPTAETRAVAITDPELARELLRSVRAHRVVDLTVLNSMDNPVWWMGEGVGNYAFPYHSVDPVSTYTGGFGPYWVNTHMVDSRTGTHVSPPAHYGPPSGFNIDSYGEEVRGWVREFETAHGALKTTDMTSDKVPIHYFMGPARVIDVQYLVGTTEKSSWPASPQINVADIDAYEKRYGPIKAGEVVVFHTGHTDTQFRPVLRGREEMVMKAPLDGKTEGWVAVSPEVVKHLAGKGVRHIAIDTPSAGSVVPKERAFTYWAAANEGMIFTEFLTNVGALPPTGAFYVFLNPKIENNHGGPGRAIAILPYGQGRQTTAMQ